MTNIELGLRIAERRQQLGLTMDHVAQQVGVAKSTIQRYETGQIKRIKLPVIESIAAALKVNPDWLIGNTDDPIPKTASQPESSYLPSNVVPLQPMKQIPLVGSIACGTPILAEENISDYIDLPGHIRADFALTCKGDSMINAGIRDADIVYIRKQETLDNGQIAAVLIDGEEATLKRFYHVNGIVSLNAENPSYSPMVFVGEEAAAIRILGLVVGYTHAFG